MHSIKEITTDILIIGAGAAGLSVYYGAKKAGSRALICDEREYAGGILPQCIHEGFGLGYFGENLTGPGYLNEYMRKLPQKGLENDLLLKTTALSVTKDRTALLSNETGLIRVHFRKLAVCTGCREKTFYSLICTGERPQGIYTAGEAQELINIRKKDIGQVIVILGSGDIGQIMARRFTLLGKRVAAVIEQKDRLGGLLRNRRDCIDAFNIPVMLNSTVTEIHGYPDLRGVTVKNSVTGTEDHIPCDTLVTGMGLIPDKDIAADLLDNGRYPDWVFFSGNASHVHEIVDAVTKEGEALGASLANEY